MMSRMDRSEPFALLFQSGEGCGEERLPAVTAADELDGCVLTHLFCEREGFFLTGQALVTLRKAK